MSATKVSLLVPTRHRVARLEVLLGSIFETVEDFSQFEVIFRVDEDDSESQAFLKLCGHKMVVGPRHNGYDSMPLFFNELATAATGDVLVCGNDDMTFGTKGWPALVLAEAAKYEDGIYDIGVSTFNQGHYPFSIVSKAVVNHLGYLWDPRIFWGDIFLRDVMQAFGRCVELPSVVFHHDWAGNAPDEVFNEADKDIVRRNPTYWTIEHRSAVDDAVVKLRGLR